MTAQLEESILIDGHYRPMATCPDFPVDGSRIRRIPEPDFFADNSACWRGYIGSWEIRESCLYLVDLHGLYLKHDSAPIHASWYSGTLRILMGEMLEYVHMGFGSVYEEELRVKVKRGRVVRMKKVDNREGKSDPLIAWYRRWLMGSWWRSRG